jgi:hypothetical protein
MILDAAFGNVVQKQRDAEHGPVLRLDRQVRSPLRSNRGADKSGGPAARRRGSTTGTRAFGLPGHLPTK